MSNELNSIDAQNADENSNRNRVQDTTAKSKDSIESIIGKGDDAKNSIMWITIRWCLAIPLIITVLHFVTLWIAYYLKLENEYKDIKEYMVKIWSVFAPIITLALGYLYGKSETNKQEKQ